jgi:hypothetical protein
MEVSGQLHAHAAFLPGKTPGASLIGEWVDMYGVRPLEHWDRGLASYSRHGYLSVFFYVVLSCVCRGLAMGRSPFKESYQNFEKHP